MKSEAPSKTQHRWLDDLSGKSYWWLWKHHTWMNLSPPLCSRISEHCQKSKKNIRGVKKDEVRQELQYIQSASVRSSCLISHLLLVLCLSRLQITGNSNRQRAFPPACPCIAPNVQCASGPGQTLDLVQRVQCLQCWARSVRRTPSLYFCRVLLTPADSLAHTRPCLDGVKTSVCVARST